MQWLSIIAKVDYSVIFYCILFGYFVFKTKTETLNYSLFKISAENLIYEAMRNFNIDFNSDTK